MRVVRRLIDENRLFSTALGAGALLRLVAMLGYPGALWFSGDSYVYLGAALRPRPDLSKTTGYSFFLRALEPLHSLTLVIGVQHLMGLGIAVMVYALARRAGVSERWSVAATLPVLLDGFQIEDEHMVMAETLFTFLIVLAMLLILWNIRVRWPVALLAGILAGYAVIVRSEGLPVLVLFPLALALRDGDNSKRRLWRWHKQWRQWAAAGLMAAGCAMPVLAYAGWFHHVNHTYGLTRSDGFYLWGRASSFADCAVIRPPAGEARVCPSGVPSKRQPPGSYIWHAPMVHDLPGGPVSSANDTLLRNFAILAVERQPFAYMGAVFKGLALSVEWPRKKYPSAGTVSDYLFHLKTQVVPASHSWIPGGTAYADAVRYGGATPSRVIKPFAYPVAGYERLFYTYGPLFGLIMVTGAWGVWRRRGSGPGWSALPWVTAVVLLVFPIAIADFDYRYLLPVLPFAGLAAALAFAPAAKLAAKLEGCPKVPEPVESSLSKG
ncbi:MAG TPA: phospholipid carrier-dependent glycosyltransferase [Streptosporangiaceae bacterium]